MPRWAVAPDEFLITEALAVTQQFSGKYRQAEASYAQAQLGLARAYAMPGDKANARKAYEASLATWKNADPDLPMLVAGKKEYAGL